METVHGFFASKKYKSHLQWLSFDPFIRISGETIFYKTWRKKGVKCIGIILIINGEFLNLVKLKGKFNMQLNFLTYYSWRVAITVECKQKIHLKTIHYTGAPSMLRFRINGEPMNIEHISCKEIYWYIIEISIEESPTCVNRWPGVLGNTISKWNKIFKFLI